jgi:SAM-dependent methyltransferase
MHFDAMADEYAAGRPPYPSALWETITELGVMKAGHRALDLGAGTGQATGPLRAAGLHVTAVEPGERLAQRLHASHPAADVLVVRAEDAELAADSFDLAVAATSIHWMDLSIVVPKLHRALRPDGMLLVWRTVFGDPDVPLTPFRQRVMQIVAQRGPLATPGTGPEDADATAGQLTASGLFAVDRSSTFRWSIDLDEEGVRRLFATFSDWSPDEVNRAAAAVRDLGGTVVEHYLSWLLVLKPSQSVR